jgi:hypothetical protein
MNVHVVGCAVCGPGLPDWPRARAVLRGESAFDATLVRDPAPVALPPNERRRLPPTARLALGIGMEALDAAGMATREVVTVFTSCGSDGQITHQICEALAKPVPEMSPTRFHNSVHNAPGGYWSIAFGSHAPSTSLCGYEGSFAAGLVEAATQATVERVPVLLVAYDLPYPAPLSALWNVGAPFSAALMLAPQGAGRALDVELVDEPVSGWPPTVPSTLATHPAAASLRLLALLARDEPGRAVLPYHAGRRVAVACR